MSSTIHDGGLVIKDPADVEVYQFDWDTDPGLPTSVTIATQTVTATAISPSDATALTLTSSGTGLGIQSGSRKVNVKVAGGDAGARYVLTNQVITSETPARTRERSFYVLVQDR
jgi:hypothetical protein